MRSVAFLAALAATLPLVSAPAAAQTADPYAPFTGARVEGLVGVDRIQDDGHQDDLMYGLGVGYDRQFGSALAGIEGEIADSDNKVCAGAGSAASPRTCLRAGRDLYVGGRVGTVVGGRALLYAKAGYTNARAKLTQDIAGNRTDFGGENLDGLRVGGGAEVALGPNSFAKAEYRYSNYEAGLERHQLLGGFGFRF